MNLLCLLANSWLGYMITSLRSANGGNLEPDLPQLFGIDEQATIEHESRLVHALVDLFPVNVEELLPLCGNNDSLCVLAGFHRRAADGYLLLD